MLSILGPVAVLVALLSIWRYGWSIYLFYPGIALMLFMSFLDLLRPIKVPTCHASS